MLARGRARRVGDGGLHGEHPGVVDVPAAGRLALGAHDLLGRADVHGTGAGQKGVGPRHEAAERPINLEDAGAVAPALESAGIARGQPVARDRQHLARSHVENDDARRGQLGERGDPVTRVQLAAERAQASDERVGHRLRPTLGHGPADSVREAAEHEADSRRERLAERHGRVRGEPREEGPRRLVAKNRAHDGGRGPQPPHAEREQLARGARRHGGRVKHRGGEARPIRREVREHPSPGPPVAAEPRGGVVDRAVQQCRAARVDRVAERRGRMHQPQPAAPVRRIALQVERPHRR